MATYKKMKIATPNGGTYSEIHFFDADGNPVDEALAVRFVVRECAENGDLICETWGYTEQKNK